MWKAELTNKAKAKQAIQYTITFSNGVDSFTRTWSFQIEESHAEITKSRVASIIYRLNNPEEISEGTILGTPEKETPAEKWKNLRLLFSDMSDLVRNGIIPPDDIEYTKLREWLTKNYDRRFLIPE